MGSTVSFMELNTKSLLLDSFKSLQNKAFIVFNGLFNNNVGGSTIKQAEEPDNGEEKQCWRRIAQSLF
jgi:hypothetical protein